ncbi:hypothetical protein BW07_05110 [Bifidobacterium sp. UTCIF-36]|nr:hypothetical protein BW08_10560 [Bifidobacterium sp. UTCIF-24]TPF84347.1 hypothetical protein BW07_05110 [Bifidobacterium sp. UTCIF-36]
MYSSDFEPFNLSYDVEISWLYNDSYLDDIILTSTLSPGNISEWTDVTPADFQKLHDMLPALDEWLDECDEALQWCMRVFPGIPLGTEEDQ